MVTSHNYMSFFKECTIPISSVPVSPTSGTSESTELTLTSQLYQNLNEIFNKGMTQQWSLAKKDKKLDVEFVTD